MKEREQRAQELKLKLSQSSGFYQESMDNQKGAFEKMFGDDYQKENVSYNINTSQKLSNQNLH